MVFGSEVLGSCLGTESRALKNGISVFIKKKTLQGPLAHFAMWKLDQKVPVNQEKGLHQNITILVI